MTNITLVVGTRPQILKSYPLVKSLRKHGFEVDVINTGQHYDHILSGVFFSDFDILPTTNLDIKPNTPNAQLARIMQKLESILKDNSDLVIVPGDTTSALAAGITAVKCGIKLAHIEAGGRSIHTKMQEEINRRLLDHASDILFTPTKNCVTNLENENVPGVIYHVGDTMYDLFLEEYKRHQLASIPHSNQILVTLHRAEKISSKNNLTQVSYFVNSMSKVGFDLIFPVHPHTKQKIKEFNVKFHAKLVDSVNHSQMLKLIAESALVVTDSGGLQKEAYWLAKPCIAVHETFEWKELVDECVNFPIWPDKPISKILLDKIIKTKFTPKPIFGTGDASEKISQILTKLF